MNIEEARKISELVQEVDRCEGIVHNLKNGGPKTTVSFLDEKGTKVRIATGLEVSDVLICHYENKIHDTLHKIRKLI